MDDIYKQLTENNGDLKIIINKLDEILETLESLEY